MSSDTQTERAAEDAERRKQVALFRHSVIGDLVHLEPGQRGMYSLLRAKAEREWDIPGSLRRHIAAETIRGWLRDYRRGGFDALVPKVRADQGCARAIPPCVVDLLCETKDNEPSLSVPLVIARVCSEHPEQIPDGLALPMSTVHRLLAKRGLMKKRASEPTTKDRRHFEFEKAGEMWMSDVMYGPKIRVGERLRQTYLIAMIDDATRLVPHAAFALSEGTVAFLPVLAQAMRRRGVPKRLYVDNGSAFRSHHLQLVCAKLGIALIHARPYSPQGKGKMERWFRTVRMQLLPVLTPADTFSIDTLNRRLWAWVESEYHHAPHRGAGGETPADRWARLSDDVRTADASLDEHFLYEQRRRVQKDRTVTLDGVGFEVDAALVGERVTLRYDPAKPPNKRTVEVFHKNQRIELARQVNAYANCFVKRNRPGAVLHADAPPTQPAEGLRMRDLRDIPDEEIF
jgi:transposase InsO family protein